MPFFGLRLGELAKGSGESLWFDIVCRIRQAGLFGGELANGSELYDGTAFKDLPAEYAPFWEPILVDAGGRRP